MTIFYLDLEAGNDANDGLSFANRWKTIGAGATAARTAPGDTIRVMATPDPVSLGNADWVDNSGTITWATAKNKVIDNCNADWVASANITITYTTPQKVGTGRLNLTPASGFTTGKAAYKTLPGTLDLSAFEQISFWFQASAAVAQFSIKLCSDTIGDTPVATLSFNWGSADVSSNVWKPAVGDNAAALGSGINSIAIYFDSDPGTAQHRFDNIVACKAAGSADELAHKLIVGKNTAGEPEWYNIQELTDTGLVFGAAINSSGPSADSPMPYRGATETAETFKRYCVAVSATADMATKESGAAGNPITYSGGWNRTDMSTQTGETWLSGDSGRNYGMQMLSGGVYINTEKFGYANFYGTGLSNLNGFQIHDAIGFVGCPAIATSYTFISSGPGRAQLAVDHIWGCNSGPLGSFSRPLKLKARLIHGDCDSAASSGAFSGTPNYAAESEYEIERIENNRSNGLYVSTTHNLKLRGTTLKNNLLADVYFNSNIYAKVELDDCELLSSTPIATQADTNPIEVHETRIGGDPALNKITRAFSYFKTQASVVHSGSVAWELGLITAEAFWIEEPAFFPLASIACNAGTLVTVKAWLRRTSTNVGAGLRIAANPVQGITETKAWMTAAIDTWEEVTLTFTPTTAGVFDIMAMAYGPVGEEAFFDGDITVTQA